MKKADIEFAVIQPLIGNVAIAGENIFGKQPKYIVTYGAPNDKLYMHYRPDVKVITMGFDNVPITEEDKTWFAKNKSCGCVIGLPVCAGLSTLTQKVRKDGTKIVGNQNDNMLLIADLAVNIIQPDVYLFENAFQLYTNSGQEVYQGLQSIAANSNGYRTNIIKTDTQLHGIPQRRHRTFMYFFKNGNALLPWREKETLDLESYMKKMPKSFLYQEDRTPEKFKNAFAMFIDYLEADIGKDWREHVRDKNVQSLLYYIVNFNSIDRLEAHVNNRTDQKKIDFMKDYGVKFKDLIHKIKNDISHINPFVPEIEKRGYIMAMQWKLMGTLLHYEKDRVYNFAESLYLMGFPSDFTFPHKDDETKQAMTTEDISGGNHNMIFQNVPLCTAEDHVENALLYITGELEAITSKEIKQNNIKQTIDLMKIDSETNKLF